MPVHSCGGVVDLRVTLRVDRFVQVQVLATCGIATVEVLSVRFAKTFFFYLSVFVVCFALYMYYRRRGSWVPPVN